MRNRAVEAVGSVLLGALACVTAGCGGASDEPPPADEVEAVAPDALATVAASGRRVLDADRFRFDVRDLSEQAEFRASCNPGSDRISGAMDLGRRLAAFDLEGGEDVDVVVSATTSYVRASALDQWDIGATWLGVPLDDVEMLDLTAIATGLAIAPTFWDQAGAVNPANGLDDLAAAITEVTPEGEGKVRGVPTTVFRATVDPEASGAWTGGVPTTSAVPPTTLSADEQHAQRADRLARLLDDDEATIGEIPDDIRAAYLDGDVEALVDHMESESTEPVEPLDRVLIVAVLGGDVQAAVDEAEETTGTTIPPEDLAFIEALDTSSGSGDVVSGLLQAMTSIEVVVHVDDDGLLRRLDLAVDAVSLEDEPEDGSDDAPAFFVDTSTEFWDIGAPLDLAEPPADEVTLASDLPADAVPSALSPCFTRLGD